MATERRAGQALIELAVGMFALSLVLAALFAFADYIIRGLEIHRTLRSDAGRSALTLPGDVGFVTRTASDTVKVGAFAAEHLFGAEELRLRESVSLPGMAGLQ